MSLESPWESHFEVTIAFPILPPRKPVCGGREVEERRTGGEVEERRTFEYFAVRGRNIKNAHSALKDGVTHESLIALNLHVSARAPKAMDSNTSTNTIN